MPPILHIFTEAICLYASVKLCQLLACLKHGGVGNGGGWASLKLINFARGNRSGGGMTMDCNTTN